MNKKIKLEESIFAVNLRLFAASQSLQDSTDAELVIGEFVEETFENADQVSVDVLMTLHVVFDGDLIARLRQLFRKCQSAVASGAMLQSDDVLKILELEKLRSTLTLGF